MSDDTLLAAESLLATLAAAEAHLTQVIATSLPFPAAARVHRGAVRDARRRLTALGVQPRGLLGLAPPPAPPEPEELPGGDAPELLPEHAILDSAEGESDLIATAEPSVEGRSLFEIPAELQHLPEPSPDAESLEPLADDSPPLVSFDEPLVQFDEPPAEGPPLVHFEAEDTLTQLEDLVSSDQPLVQFVDFDEDEEDTQETADTPHSDLSALGSVEDDALAPHEPVSTGGLYSAPVGRVSPPDEEEATLIADLEDLMQPLEPPGEEPLEPEFLDPTREDEEDPHSTDLDYQDESSVYEVIVPKAAAPSSPPPPSPRASVTPPPPAPDPAPSEEAPTPRASTPREAAPASSPRPAPSPRQVRPRLAQAGASKAEPRFRASAYGSSVPTIRDGSGPRPKAAAIRLSADQKTSTVLGEDEELLELGAAAEADEDYQDDPSSTGFRLDVEELEEIEYVDELEEEDEVEMAAPAPIPQLVQPSDEELDRMFGEAVRARDQGRMDEAINLFSDILDADPDHVEAHLGRGRVFLDLADYARAMSDFTVAVDLSPESAEPLVALGDFYFARKEYSRAIQYFNEALSAQDDHAMAYCRRGISHYYRRDYDAAVKDLARAKKLDPEIPNIGTYLNTAKKRRRR